MKKYILAAVLAITLIWTGAAQSAASSASLPTVEIAPCGVETLRKTLSCSGIVEAAEYRSLCLPAVSVITELSVAVGDKVKKGQTLFRAASLESAAEYGIEDFLASALGQVEILSALTDGTLAEQVLGQISPEAAAAVFASGDALAYTAPIDGTVTAVNIRKDGVALPGVICVTVTDTSSLRVRARVQENDLYRLRSGQEAAVTIRGANDKVKGTVSELPAAVRASGTLLSAGEQVGEALISLKGATSALPGMSCTVKITTQTVKNAYTVPYDCLRQDDEGWYIYTTDGRRVSKTYVEYGLDAEDRVQVTTADGAPFYYLTDMETEWEDGAEIRWIRKEQTQ